MKRSGLLLAAALGLWSASHANDQANTAAAGPGDTSSGQRVSIKEFASMIASADEMVQAQRLEEAVASQGLRGAQALFEPFFTSTLEREGQNVLTSAQDAARIGVQPMTTFFLKESRFKNALGMKAPTGADLELSYNITNWQDSVQPLRQVYETEKRGFVGFKVTQPMIRGAGQRITRMGMDVADREKAVATETWRQVLAQRVMDGLQSYIFVQRAEERVRLRTQARDVALQIAQNMGQQHASGLRSASELTEARSSLALREAQLAQALQDLEEQQNALQVFLSGKGSAKDDVFVASKVLPGDRLDTAKPLKAENLTDQATRKELLKSAIEKRPEARVNNLRIEREDLKAQMAQDQSRPEFNFYMSYGRESLNYANQPFQNYFGGQIPYNRWTVGVTYKVGIFGDEKRDSDYQAAMIRREQSELALGAIKQRITNEVLVSTTVLQRAQQQAARQFEIAAAQRNLLQVEKDMVKEGRRSSMDVMKKQLEVLTAEEALADAVAQVNRAGYLNAQVEGSLLSKVGLE